VIGIIEEENLRVGNKYIAASFKLLNRPSFKTDVKDSPRIFRVNGISPEYDSIIAISNTSFPNFVNYAVERTSEAANKLSPRLGKHILRPSTTGYAGTQSYAIWPRQQPISNNKFLRRAQLQTINKGVFQWLCDLSKYTQNPVNSGEELNKWYIDPLMFLLRQECISNDIKRITSETLRSIETSVFRPVSVLQHGDFWYGNVLLKRYWPFSLKSPSYFYVIDWSGANINGYPFIDGLRYFLSIGIGDPALKNRLNIYSDVTEVKIKEVLYYTCAYIGYLGVNRNEFPLDRYLDLAKKLFRKASVISKGMLS